MSEIGSTSRGSFLNIEYWNRYCCTCSHDLFFKAYSQSTWLFLPDRSFNNMAAAVPAINRSLVASLHRSNFSVDFSLALKCSLRTIKLSKRLPRLFILILISYAYFCQGGRFSDNRFSGFKHWTSLERLLFQHRLLITASHPCLSHFLPNHLQSHFSFSVRIASLSVLRENLYDQHKSVLNSFLSSVLCCILN